MKESHINILNHLCNKNEFFLISHFGYKTICMEELREFNPSNGSPHFERLVSAVTHRRHPQATKKKLVVEVNFFIFIMLIFYVSLLST